jgi:hypothetical protein
LNADDIPDAFVVRIFAVTDTDTERPSVQAVAALRCRFPVRCVDAGAHVSGILKLAVAASVFVGASDNEHFASYVGPLVGFLDGRFSRRGHALASC